MGKCNEVNERVKIFMKTEQQIKELEKYNSDTFQHLDFITNVENNSLKEYFQDADKIEKNTGPVVANINLENSVFNNIFHRLQEIIGPVDLMSAIIFKTPWAHVIHNDVDLAFENPYKAVTIPLEVIGEAKDTDIKLVMFDQYYYHAGKKFMNGGTPKVNQFYSNGPLLSYEDVSYKNNKGIAKDIKEKYLTHCQPNWLENLSVNSYFPWKINSAIIFDCARLHCSSDFNSQGADGKLAMSIFTARKQ